MEYRNIVNKELRIAAIRTSKLQLRDAAGFLNCWDEKATIGDLTLYYDEKTDYVVLNCDNVNYKKNLEFAESFLMADYEKVREFRCESLNALEETAQVLKNVRIKRQVKRDMFIIMQQETVLFEDTYIVKIFREIERESTSSLATMSLAFNYGMICGKRKERSKRKKAS